MSDASRPGVAVVLEQIAMAFPLGEPPDECLLWNRHCTECEETSAIFVGRRWPDIQVDDLRGNPSPSLLSAAAFVHFLPAMLSCVLVAGDELDCFPDELVAMLSPPRGALDPFHAERLGSLSKEQAAAVLGFLNLEASRYRSQWAEPGWPEEAVAATPLDRPLARAIEYWTERVGESSPMRGVDLT